MKKTLFFPLFIISCLSITAQTVGDAFYIYRNDGDFNAFFYNDVKSIVYSTLDINGVQHSEFVTQEIWTSDSVFRIPIESIDSVSFVQPKAVLNANVFTLAVQHSPYILQADTLSFVFNVNTPVELLPQQGNIVVSTYDCLSFPNGIMAKVVNRTKQADGIHYECERASIDDVYDQIVYYGYGDVYDDQNDYKKQTRADARVSGILWDDTIEGTISYGGINATLSDHVSGAFEIVLRKTLGNPMYAKLTFSNKLTSRIAFNANSEADIEPDPIQLGKTLTIGRITIPEFPLIWFEPQLKLYGYFEEKGSANLDFSAQYSRLDKFQLTCSNKTWKFKHTISQTEESIDVASLSMNGSIEVGVQPEIMISLNGFPTGVGISTRVGLRENVDFEFDTIKYLDEKIYESVINSQSEESIILSGSVFAQLGVFENDCSRGDFTIPEKVFPISEHYLLPIFKGVNSAKAKDKQNAYTVASSLNRDLLMPVNVGFGLFDENNNLIKSEYISQPYHLEKEWSQNGLGMIFEDIEQGKKYVCSPMVKFLGTELRASPSTMIDTNMMVQTGDIAELGPYSVDISGKIFYDQIYDFEYQIGICYTEKGSSEGWNYVPVERHRINGNNFSVSLYNLKPETEYLYCAYIQFGEDDITYGEERSFVTLEVGNLSLSCPDGNHPHLVDLGLPSGTCWACCNLGASSPKDYGTFYAWGETWTKSVFDEDTYAKDHLIENSLQGMGAYDAAKANWGNDWVSWVTPDTHQYNELCFYTESVWFNMDGVEGRLFTGRNGKSIFLPKGGLKKGAALIEKDYGIYWTATTGNGANIEYPRAFIVGSNDYGLSFTNYYRGLVIRPSTGNPGFKWW